jgi:WD40 repeat protein
VKVWEPFTGAEQGRVSIPPLSTAQSAHSPLRWLTLSGDGSQAVVYQDGGQMVFLDLIPVRLDARSSKASWEWNRPLRALKWSPEGNAVVGLSDVSKIHWWPSRLYRYDFAKPLPNDWIGHLQVILGPARALAFSPDGTRLAAGRTVQAWPPCKTWPPPPTDPFIQFGTESYEPENLAFSADNSHLFASVGWKIAVYSLPSGLFKMNLDGHCGQITAMVLSPDGHRLWTASRDATVKCWDTHSLTLDRTFTFQTGGLDCLAVSPDGNVAAVGSGQKGTITVWDLG